MAAALLFEALLPLVRRQQMFVFVVQLPPVVAAAVLPCWRVSVQRFVMIRAWTAQMGFVELQPGPATASPATRILLIQLQRIRTALNSSHSEHLSDA